MTTWRNALGYGGLFLGSGYRWTIVAFFCLQALFLSFRKSPALLWLAQKGDDVATTTILIVSVHLLVIANTLIYFFDTRTTYGASELKGDGERYKAAVCLLLLSVGFSAAMILAIVLFTTGLFDGTKLSHTR